MLKLIWHDIKRVLYSPAFWIGILAFIVLGFLQQFDAIAGKSRMLKKYGVESFGAINRYIFSTSGYLLSRQISFSMPILAALPSTTLFLTEYKSRYMRNVLTRTGKKRYAVSKFIAAFISGAVLVLIGELFLLILSVALDPHKSLPILWYTIPGESFALPLYAKSRLLYALVSSGNLILNGGIYSCLALGFSALWNNKYLAYASGFLLNNIAANDITRACNLPIMSECLTLWNVSSYSKVLIIYGALFLLAAVMFFVMYNVRSKTDV